MVSMGSFYDRDNIFHLLITVANILDPTYIRQKVSEYDQEKYTITHCTPTHSTVRKSYKTFKVTRYPKDNKKQSNQLSPPRQDDCKTRKDSK